MLVLTRKKNESIVINDVIKVMVVDIRGDKVRLGIQAPREIEVHRQEVYDQIHGKYQEVPRHETTNASIPQGEDFKHRTSTPPVDPDECHNH